MTSEVSDTGWREWIEMDEPLERVIHVTPDGIDVQCMRKGGLPEGEKMSDYAVDALEKLQETLFQLLGHGPKSQYAYHFDI